MAITGCLLHHQGRRKACMGTNSGFLARSLHPMVSSERHLVRPSPSFQRKPSLHGRRHSHLLKTSKLPGLHENVATCCTHRAPNHGTKPAWMVHTQNRMEVHAIAAAFNFVGRQNSSLMCDTSPVPLSLLPPAVSPLSFQARAECPGSNPEPSTAYVSPVSPAVIHAQSQAVTFKVSEELHISFDKELTLSAAGKLTQVLLQDEWPSAPRDQGHDPEPPALDWDNIPTSASESSLERAHDSENDTDYWDSD